LRGSKHGARSPQAQFLVEHIGRGAQQPPQLVGKNAAGTGAVDFQVAPDVVMGGEKSQLLGAVRLIIRGIQLDRDPRRLALQAPAVPLDHGV
jgi:hypothetical protein